MKPLDVKVKVKYKGPNARSLNAAMTAADGPADSTDSTSENEGEEFDIKDFSD